MTHPTLGHIHVSIPKFQLILVGMSVL